MTQFFAGHSSAGPRDPTPKYLRICRLMTEAIETRRLRPGDALPSQKEMAEHYGVTLMTLRQALRVMADNGHLRIEHGRGTFVADRPYRLPLDGLGSFPQQIGADHAVRTELLAAQDMPAPHGVPARMGLQDAVVFCITRLRFVDDLPLVYSMSLLEPALGHRLDLRGLRDGSLYDALTEQLGIMVDRAVETFRASAIDEPESTWLRREVGSPALVSSRLTYARDGTALVDDRAIMPGDGVVISTERRTDDPDLRLRLRLDPEPLTRVTGTTPATPQEMS